MYYIGSKEDTMLKIGLKNSNIVSELVEENNLKFETLFLEDRSVAIVSYSKFDQYKEQLFSLSQIDEETIKSEPFLLDQDEKKKIEIYYTPFEYINEKAKVLIVGITPGLHQMKTSYSTVKNHENSGLTDEKILHEVKKNSSFAGSMRKNLIAMLDQLDLQNHLGIGSTSELFHHANHLVHTNSVISYAVFYNGKNYNGSTPDMLKNELLKTYILKNFTTELRSLNHPLIIPLGVNVSKVLHYLAENGYVEQHLMFHGFPHPSGGNGHRHKQFSQNKENMQRQMETYFRSYS